MSSTSACYPTAGATTPLPSRLWKTMSCGLHFFGDCFPAFLGNAPRPISRTRRPDFWEHLGRTRPGGSSARRPRPPKAGAKRGARLPRGWRRSIRSRRPCCPYTWRSARRMRLRADWFRTTSARAHSRGRIRIGPGRWTSTTPPASRTASTRKKRRRLWRRGPTPRESPPEIWRRRDPSTSEWRSDPPRSNFAPRGIVLRPPCPMTSRRI
mmetsp:Transcript_12600/g.27180  ORF Transcript_12600/g.27180 Transcript_12600/m.27180 type:complete len:210 (-) Transcript_12600:234-863(-)